MNRLLKSFFGLTLGVAFSLGVAASLNSNKNHIAKETVAEEVISGNVFRLTLSTNDWESGVYAYAYGNGVSMEWPGVSLGYAFNGNSQKVYTYTNTKKPDTIIFHNNRTDNGKGRRTTVSSSSNTAWYITGNDGTWKDGQLNMTSSTWTPSNNTFYLYDYRNLFGGNAKCYAWQSGGSYINADYPGVAMTPVQYGSGQLYSITLDPAFDEFKLGIGDSSNTGDIWINQKIGQCYCFWESNPGFSEDLNWVKAHDWANNTMHIRDIPTSTGGDTGACRGVSGYYQKAKIAYNSFSDDIKEQFQYVDEYEDAQTRFIAWAKANGETASFSGSTLTISSARSFVPFSLSGDNNNTIIVLATISALGILSVGAYYFFRKSRKAEE